MAAIIDFIQFRKASGFTSTTDVLLSKWDPVVQALAWGFFGRPDTLGYLSNPTDFLVTASPVEAGTASWEVLLAVQVVGISFVVVTDIRLSLETLNTANLGTIAGDTVSAFISVGTIPIDRSGLYMRSMPGNIELGLPPEPIDAIIPNTAPSWGLPYQPEGWLLTLEKGADPYIDIEDGTKTNPPNSADLTPFREDGVKALYPSDLEPRYSNFAVLNFVVASDASTQAIVNPVEMLVTWSES